MRYRRVGKTGIVLSAIGFGTAQLPMIPERQAVATLRRGFELGVNWVHVSHEYGDAERLVARAIRESGRDDIVVLSQASGDVDHFEHCFENTARLLGTRRLAMFGINCVNDCEFLGQNVWGPGGMAEFLRRKKEEGRLGASFCTTHGPPADVERVIASGYFDAVMIAYNPLGFHLFTYYPESIGRTFESIGRHRERIFPLALDHGVSLLIMKALASGLLLPSKALPPHEWLGPEEEAFTAAELLRSILLHPAVCAVVVGTASVDEAEENARAGEEPIEVPEERLEAIDRAVSRTRAAVCSRCGQCEATCSNSLPIATMFRDAYIWNHRSETMMALDRENYFLLHPDETLRCETCSERTCVCPADIDIPVALGRVHDLMVRLRGEGLHPGSPEQFPGRIVPGRLPVLLVSSEVPRSLRAGEQAVCRLLLHNAGQTVWLAPGSPSAGDPLELAVYLDGRLLQRVALRHDVPPGTRTTVVVELPASPRAGTYELQCGLVPPGARARRPTSPIVLAVPITVENGAARGGSPAFASGLGAPLRSLVKWAQARGFVPSARRAWPTPPAVIEKRSRYGIRYVDHTFPFPPPAGQVAALRLTLENTGTFVWQANARDGHSVDVVVRIDDVIKSAHKLPRSEVRPDERVTLHLPVAVPAAAGRYTVSVELVEQNVSWFRDRGVAPFRLTLDVEKPAEGWKTSARDSARRIDPWFYNPSASVEVSAEGHRYPLLVSRAKGCRLWDLEGREFVDYIMGWGSTLLGYADARVQRAIRDALETAPLAPFPYPVEMDVARMLTEDFPCAEMVIFGKNGSDVCTVAARLARVTTGRRVILFSGYHGWGDFWVESVGFPRTGVPDRPEALIHRFRFNSAGDFFALYNRYRDDLAAVMIEPSGPWGGDHVGPEPDADRAFLRAVADATRAAGALLVFDEIVTCYRYPTGSVQKATGITPDMACLGKALASGMPLSALVGRADLFQQGLPRTHYGPTFKGELYSFAAARAAIEIYRREPVAEHIWRHGRRLKSAIDAIARDVGVDAEVQGPPFRFAPVFNEPDAETYRLKRTLYHQELLKKGVTTVNGVMLPSYAHDDAVLEQTLEAVRHALGVVARADHERDFERYLEIPTL